MEKLLDLLGELLNYLDGKKAVIMAVSTLINSFAVSQGLYSPDFGTLINGILSILAGGAVLATPSLGARVK